MSRSVHAACVLAAAILSLAGAARADVSSAASLMTMIAVPASLPAAKSAHRHHGAAQDAVIAHPVAGTERAARHHQTAHRHHRRIVHHTVRLTDGSRTARTPLPLPAPSRAPLPQRSEHTAMVPHAASASRASSHGRSHHLAALAASARGCAAPRVTGTLAATEAPRVQPSFATALHGRAPPARRLDARWLSSVCVAGLRRSPSPATLRRTSDHTLTLVPADSGVRSRASRSAFAVVRQALAERQVAASRGNILS